MSIDRSSGVSRIGLSIVAALALLTIVAGVATMVAIRRARQLSTPVPSLRLTLMQPDELVVGGEPDYQFGLSLAPDGRRLVFPAANGDARQIWLRDLTHDDLQPIPGTTDGVLPFWSPDGGSLGFFAGGKLRVFVFGDGRVHDLADASAPRGAAWHPHGDILFAPDDDGPLQRRRPDGRVEPFSTLANGAESSHRHPQIVNAGAHVIFFVRSSEPTRQGIWIAPYAQPAARKRLAKSDAHGLAIDHTLIYSSGSALLAQNFDADAGTLTGRSVLLATEVGHGLQHQLFATAAGDVLISGVPSSDLRELRWTDRSGTPGALVGEPMDVRDVRIAPDAATVAVARVEPPLGTLDIWSYEAARPLPRRLSPSIDADDAPVWSRDGRRLAWVTGRRTITVRDAAAAEPDVTLRKFPNAVTVTDWPDDRWLIVTESRPDSRNDILVIPANSTGESRDYAHTPFNEAQGVVSPDGRWLAYSSDESGRFEIYVDAFPTPGRRGRLTVGGGAEPRWRRDGTELFFRRGSELHAVRVGLTGEVPVALASERLFDAGAEIRAFDVAPDGQRFLLNVPAPGSGTKPMTVLVNVRSLLPSAR
jgi:Tol biopolymer transport system component